MKWTISAIFYYMTYIVHAAFPPPCVVPCKNTTNYRGSEPFAVKTGTHAIMGYDSATRLLMFANLLENAVLIPHNKIIYVLNVKDGAYMAIDWRSGYAVLGKTKSIKGGAGNFDEVVKEMSPVTRTFDTIYPSTPKSFDFSLLSINFYNRQFDIEKMFKDKKNVVSTLKQSFGGLLRSLKIPIQKGVIDMTNGLRGFFTVWVRMKIQTALGMFEAMFVPNKCENENISHYLLIEIIKLASICSQRLLEFVTAHVDAITTGKGVCPGTAINMASRKSHRPVDITLKFNDVDYKFKISKFPEASLLRFSLPSATGEIQEITIISSEVSLLIINKKTKLVALLSEDSIVITHLFNSYVLVITDHGQFGTFTDYNYWPMFIATNQLHLIQMEVKNFLYYLKPAKKFTFAKIYSAYKSGNINEVVELFGDGIGNPYLENYKPFFSQCGSESFGDIVVGILGNKNLPLVKSWVTTFNTIVTTHKKWKEFFPMIGVS